MNTILVTTIKSRTQEIWRIGRRFGKEPAAVEIASLGVGELARLIKDPALVGRDAQSEAVLFEDGTVKSDVQQALIDGVDPDAADGLAERLEGAIRALGPDGYTKSGKPDVAALQAALPEDAGEITAKRRDAAWEALQATGFEAPVAS